MTSILVTGSDRALGLQWARQYAQAGWRVHATCRHPEDAHELKELVAQYAGVHLHRLDVTKPDEIRAVAMDLSAEPIDVLVNNAGVFLESFGKPELGHFRYEDWDYTLQVNTMGAVRISEALLEHVARSERRLVVAISSQMGSIAELSSPGSYYYRSSKAALNAVMKGLAVELRPRGIGVLVLHPGWVRTRMGGPDATLSPEESVRGMRELVERFTLDNTGRFFRYDGTEIPW
jgi:NAD(P)-dependent dehydrogenase (short-subunit alcohol dehydrogenase family)